MGCYNSLPNGTLNTHFLGLSFNLYLWRFSKVLLRLSSSSPTLFRLHYHIINVCLNVPSDLSFQDDLDALLICSSLILETKCHLSITEDSKWSNKRCFFFIVNGEVDLMTVQISMQK
jgi:hypothetical protein